MIPASPASPPSPASPGFRGYVDAGALELYCERRGAGHPLVLTSHEEVLDRMEWLSSMITAFLLPGSSDEPPVSS